MPSASFVNSPAMLVSVIGIMLIAGIVLAIVLLARKGKGEAVAPPPLPPGA
jgi:hypothetical protein